MKSIALIALLATGVLFAQAPAKDAKKPAKPAPAAPAKPAEAAKPAATPAKAAPAAKPVAGGFVGNKDSKTYHAADCKTAARMKEGNRVALASKEEAEKQGYKACKVCLK